MLFKFTDCANNSRRKSKTKTINTEHMYVMVLFSIALRVNDA